MSKEKNHKEIPKLSKEVIDLIKDFPNYYNDHNKIGVFGEPICIGELSINLALTEDQKKIIEEKITNQELRERYKDYGLCRECQQPNTGAHEYKKIRDVKLVILDIFKKSLIKTNEIVAMRKLTILLKAFKKWQPVANES